MASTRRGFWDRDFHLFFALLVAAIVVAGFAPHLDERLLHPRVPRPFILHLHAVVFGCWVLLFIVQAALVNRRRVLLHRRLGMAGAVLGLTLPVIGLATAIVLGQAEGHHSDDDAAFLAVSTYDMLAFAVTFGLALWWRKRPERHRRLMLIATAGLCSAAIARVLPGTLSFEWVYVGVDALILLGVLRDLVLTRRVHSTYVVAVPLVVAAQALAMYLFLSQSPVWLAVAHRWIG